MKRTLLLVIIGCCLLVNSPAQTPELKTFEEYDIYIKSNPDSFPAYHNR